MMVWVGKDDAKDIDNTASYYSKNIWLDTLEGFFKDKEPIWYETPVNVIGVVKDGITGEDKSDGKNNTILYYVKGTELGVSMAQESIENKKNSS